MPALGHVMHGDEDPDGEHVVRVGVDARTQRVARRLAAAAEDVAVRSRGEQLGGDGARVGVGEVVR